MGKFATLAILLVFQGTAFCAGENCLKNAVPRQQLISCTQAIESWQEDEGEAVLFSYYLKRAQAYGRLERYGDAFADMDKAGELNPQSGEFWLARGWLGVHAGYYARALADFSKALKLLRRPKETGWAYYGLAAAYEIAGNSAVAEKQLAAARATAPELYGAYLKEKEIFAGKLLAREEGIRSSFQAGKDLAAKGRPDEALVQFENALSSAPDNQEIRSWRGSVLCEMGKCGEGLAELEAAPPSDRWNFYAGLCLLKLSRYDEAIAAFEAAAQDAPPKNRGVYAATQAAEYVGKIKDYKQNYEQAKAASDAGNRAQALQFITVALSSLETDEAKKFLALQRTSSVREKAAFKSGIFKTLGLLVMLAALVFLGRAAIKNWRAISEKMQQKKEDFYKTLEAKTPREAVMAYFDYKPAHDDEAPVIAKRLAQRVAESRDFDVVRSFSKEFAGSERSAFLVAAAENFNKSCQFAQSLDALQILNMIPFPDWKEKEIAAFTTAHLICDGSLLDEAQQVDPALWSQEIPAQAYLTLARIYSEKKEEKLSAKVLERMPFYKWEKEHWKLYISSMAALGRLASLDLSALPDDMRSQVLEEIFRLGDKKKVQDFFSNEPRQKWAAEYYFYAFAYAVREHYADPSPLYFDSAWELYKELAERFDLKTHVQTHYMMAALCEKAGRFDRAGEIYAKMRQAAAAYHDSARRLAFLENGKEASLSPKADEILAPILPHGFFPAA